MKMKFHLNNLKQDPALQQEFADLLRELNARFDEQEDMICPRFASGFDLYPYYFFLLGRVHLARCLMTLDRADVYGVLYAILNSSDCDLRIHNDKIELFVQDAVCGNHWHTLFENGELNYEFAESEGKSREWFILLGKLYECSKVLTEGFGSEDYAVHDGKLLMHFIDEAIIECKIEWADRKSFFSGFLSSFFAILFSTNCRGTARLTFAPLWLNRGVAFRNFYGSMSERMLKLFAAYSFR
jgi:hypothetical protein